MGLWSCAVSKYSIAKQQIQNTIDCAKEAGIDGVEALEALTVMLVQELKSGRGADHTRQFLQYEIDSLGSGGFFEIQKR